VTRRAIAALAAVWLALLGYPAAHDPTPPLTPTVLEPR
jgi:hypothetical protein